MITAADLLAVIYEELRFDPAFPPGYAANMISRHRGALLMMIDEALAEAGLSAKPAAVAAPSLGKVWMRYCGGTVCVTNKDRLYGRAWCCAPTAAASAWAWPIASDPTNSASMSRSWPSMGRSCPKSPRPG